MIGLYYCKNERRRQAVSDSPVFNGIDYLEVASDDQKTLHVHFLNPLPGQAEAIPAAGAVLTSDNIVIEGGVRTVGIKVIPADPVTKALQANGNTLVVEVDQAGDFSTYTLRLTASPFDEAPPPGFDPQLSEIEFSFKINCPSEFDCRTEAICPPNVLNDPPISYLAKDYSSFRRLMLDRLSLLMPDWKERSPADLQITLVELIAYLGDYLSYHQDAAATEAYLATARLRKSVRRHTRLLDYILHEGNNARVWVAFEISGAAFTLPEGTKLLTQRDPVGKVNVTDFEQALTGEPLVFETMHDIELTQARGEVHFYTWDDQACCLPRESTQATLINDPPLNLQVGEVLIFEEIIGPATGNEADADPLHRHAVRLTEVEETEDALHSINVVKITWHEEDALPFPLCICTESDSEEGALLLSNVSVVRANVVLADHGRQVTGQTLDPAVVPTKGDGAYRPVLRQGDITFANPFHQETAALQSAGRALEQESGSALPVMSLALDDHVWLPQIDLLGSNGNDRAFVVETEGDGSVQLRFGDSVHGREPVEGKTFKPVFRIGNGNEGNVGAEAIARVDWPDGAGVIESVRNPMPAVGGVDPLDINVAKRDAPQAFRIQERAVTEADWGEIAERHSSVQKAVARFRWTGGWNTVFLSVDRRGGLPVDTKFKEEMLGFLERYRVAGYDLEITTPQFVPLLLGMTVCVSSGFQRADVKVFLLEIFASQEIESGQRGFFHPDNFTFGQPVYLSEIYATAMSVEGVASVEITVFQRFGKLPDAEIENGYLQPDELEVIRLDNDPNFPENGILTFEMKGGL